MTTADLLARIERVAGKTNYECEFQLSTVRDYMEPPGSPELEKAYQRYVREPDVNR